jgi:hypothetical protein
VVGGGGSLVGMKFHTKYRFKIHDGYLTTQVYLIFKIGHGWFAIY